MIHETFEDFQTRKLQEGYDEVLLREWAPGFTNEPHTHPFDTDALVAQGEYWLTMNGQTQYLVPGSMFELEPNVPHDERYGAEGAAYWVARKNG